MKLQREARDTLLSWAALALGAVAWFGSQQFGSNLAFSGCHAIDDVGAILIQILALLLVGGGILLSWRIWRGGAETEVRPFVALVGMLAGGLLIVAILLQLLGSLIIPACFA